MSEVDAPVDRLAPQPWMTEPATHAVLAALSDAGGAARFVGGAVRDALLGRPVGDIDIATPLSPEEVTLRLERAGVTVVPTGIAHGTVTAVVPPRHFEITTLRQDVETFGRQARVAFIADWTGDAGRRDFTMNALFLDIDGRVFDPVGGLEDLHAGRVRFVGDPATRIREDVLRLLRFYRFYAHYGRGEADGAARAACTALAPLLPGLSGERVAAETLKLLAAPDPLPTLAMMAEDGVLAVLLPEAQRRDRLATLVPLEPTPDPLRRLGALVAGDVAQLAERLRLSNEQRDRLTALAQPPWPIDLAGDDAVQRRAVYHLGVERYRDLVLLRAAETGEIERVAALLALAESACPPPFPLKGRDVTALGVPPGPEVGRLLAAVEAWWEEGDFRADRAACLAEVARRVNER
ncbi:MAG TPA: CCA tRNA nucleotidyltransferase [Stellaceae bacterium]|jgi:poly(A) polymerase|nr:CCA tRNA nucleotidyltransferase [Stellaceae bacterium]